MVTIKDKRKKKTEFGDLDIGDCFMYNGCLFVVTENAVAEENVCDNYYDSDVMNALNLGDDGLLAHFLNDDRVEPVDVEFTIL